MPNCHSRALAPSSCAIAFTLFLTPASGVAQILGPTDRCTLFPALPGCGGEAPGGPEPGPTGDRLTFTTVAPQSIDGPGAAGVTRGAFPLLLDLDAGLGFDDPTRDIPVLATAVFKGGFELDATMGFELDYEYQPGNFTSRIDFDNAFTIPDPGSFAPGATIDLAPMTRFRSATLDAESASLSAALDFVVDVRATADIDIRQRETGFVFIDETFRLIDIGDGRVRTDAEGNPIQGNNGLPIVDRVPRRYEVIALEDDDLRFMKGLTDALGLGPLTIPADGDLEIEGSVTVGYPTVVGFNVEARYDASSPVSPTVSFGTGATASIGVPVADATITTDPMDFSARGETGEARDGGSGAVSANDSRDLLTLGLDGDAFTGYVLGANAINGGYEAEVAGFGFGFDLWDVDPQIRSAFDYDFDLDVDLGVHFDFSKPVGLPNPFAGYTLPADLERDIARDLSGARLEGFSADPLGWLRDAANLASLPLFRQLQVRVRVPPDVLNPPEGRVTSWSGLLSDLPNFEIFEPTEVTPEYFLSGLFGVEQDLVLTPELEVSGLNFFLKAPGATFEPFGGPLLSETFSFDELSLTLDLFSDSFALADDAFTRVAGAAFTLAPCDDWTDDGAGAVCADGPPTAPVPLPAGVWLSLSGLVALAVARGRRRAA